MKSFFERFVTLAAEDARTMLLVALLFPALGTFMSLTATLSLCACITNVVWYEVFSKGKLEKKKNDKRSDDASDDVANGVGRNDSDPYADLSVSVWMFTYMVLAPFTLVGVALALLVLGARSRESTLCSLVFTALLAAVSLYSIWAYCLDQSVSRGGVRKARLRKIRLLTNIARYFYMQVTVEREESEDSKSKGKFREKKEEDSSNYIFCYHPHGILFFGVIGAFVSHAFPASIGGITFEGRDIIDLDIRLGTISFNNMIPFFREVNKHFGCFNVSRRVCERALDRGKNILIVPGGAQESIVAYPGTMNLILNRRRGFIRLALKKGVPLVPILSFGESDMFNLLEIKQGTLLHKVQRVYQSIFGFTVPLFWGRRLWGVPTVLPMRKPVHVVVGKPMPVDAFDGDVMSDEGKKAVEALHKKYAERLQTMYNKHKHLWKNKDKLGLKIV